MQMNECRKVDSNTNTYATLMPTLMPPTPTLSLSPVLFPTKIFKGKSCCNILIYEM